MNSILNYDPRCELYVRERTPGKKKWYIKYYLPNGVRMRRPCAKSAAEAKKLMRLKELQLLQGNFDQKDLGKMQLEGIDAQPKERLTIDNALQLYLTSTAINRTPKTQYNDKLALNNLFGLIKEQGKSHIDEIAPLDIQLLVAKLYQDGK